MFKAFAAPLGARKNFPEFFSAALFPKSSGTSHLRQFAGKIRRGHHENCVDE
jgi:hypothetical protein